jgi:hypothetical protein
MDKIGLLRVIQFLAGWLGAIAILLIAAVLVSLASPHIWLQLLIFAWSILPARLGFLMTSSLGESFLNRAWAQFTEGQSVPTRHEFR